MFWRNTSHEAIAVAARRESPSGILQITGFPKLAQRLSINKMSLLTVRELLSNKLVCNISAAELETQGISFLVEAGGAAIFYISAAVY